MKNLYFGNSENCPDGFELANNSLWMSHLLDTYRDQLGVVFLDCDYKDRNGLSVDDVVEYIVWKNRWANKIQLYSKNQSKMERLYRVLEEGRRGRSWVEI